jgi:centrosomal protein CEP76
MADASAMLSISDPIHIVLVKTEASGETSLVSSNFFEWRTVLASSGNRMSMTLELKGVGKEVIS